MILELLDEAVAAGSRLAKACELVGISARSVECWRLDGEGEDERSGRISSREHVLTSDDVRATVRAWKRTS